jgi:hypothetical protein
MCLFVRKQHRKCHRLLTFLQVPPLQIHIGDEGADIVFPTFEQRERRLDSGDLAGPQAIAAVDDFFSSSPFSSGTPKESPPSLRGA